VILKLPSLIRGNEKSGCANLEKNKNKNVCHNNMSPTILSKFVVILVFNIHIAQHSKNSLHSIKIRFLGACYI